MSVDFLLEIGCEEIPAAFLEPAGRQMSKDASSLLAGNSIDFNSNIISFYTPRRLVLYIKDVAEIQSEKEVPEKGPPRRIAFDEKGEPTRAALGFAKKWGVDIASIYVEDGYVYTKVKYGGQETHKLLEEFFCRKIIESVNFPKTMRWEESGFRFARPIRWILALFGDQVVKFQIADVKSNNLTYGHRFLAPQKIEVKDAADYFDRIKNAFVVIDAEERRQTIASQLTGAAKKHGVSVELDPDLIAETANLVEYPVVGVGHFDKSFLEVPAPVLITAMKKHQRYFPFSAENGQLAPLFAAINNLPSDEDDLITHGNEKVLKARLADARFFYDEDKKKPLEELVEGLKKVVFQESLGTVFEKCERLERTVQFLGELLKCEAPRATARGFAGKESIHFVAPLDPALPHGAGGRRAGQHVPEAARAARLCKADLLTSMVYEFPELQGIMGKEYARLSGEPVEVCEAIYEHYLPRFNGDDLPKSAAGALLSLAEKLDNLTGCIGVGLIPTSSQDPYGLRRQALAVVQIVLHFEYRVPLKVVIKSILSHLKGKVVEEHEEIINQTLEQLKQRLRFVLEQTGVPYDVINSVLAQEERDDLMDLSNRAKAIVELRKDENFSSMMTTHRRVVNILKSAPEKIPQLDPDLFADEAESVLREQLLKIKDKFLPLLDENNYVGAFEVLKPLQPAIDKFFDQVMVMVEDAKVKDNRFALLQEVADLFNRVADFSRIVIA